jgi:hypothetical protein
MATYQQDVRKLEEKFDGFELHHILRRDNETSDILARLRSSHEPPALGVFTWDLFKPSIWLEEDILVLVLRISPGEDNPVPVSGTLPGKDGPAPISEANPGASARPTGLN